MQEGGFERLRKSRAGVGCDFEPVNNNIDSMALIACQHRRLIEVVDVGFALLAAHAHAHKAFGA